MSPSGVISYTVKGPLSGITGLVVVQLPRGYTGPGNTSVRYPVIEAFPGYPGYAMSWIRTMNLGDVAAQAAAAKRMRPVLVVSAQVEFPRRVDTECVNGGPGNPQVETWLAQDVPNWVTHTFRVQTDRASWATIGNSTGGWCAAMVAMLHPAQYAAAIVMGGYFRPEFSPFYDPYPPGSQLTARYDLVALSKRQPAGGYLAGDLPLRPCLLHLERSIPQDSQATTGRGRYGPPRCRTRSQPVAEPSAGQPDLARRQRPRLQSHAVGTTTPSLPTPRVMSTSGARQAGKT
jgi:Putative esterase.